VVALVGINQNTSFLLAVVVSVGAVHHAHDIPENQVGTLVPVASCLSSSKNGCLVVELQVTLDTANVLFPAIVTVWIFQRDISNVIVVLSVAVTTFCIVPKTVGFVNDGFRL